MLNRARGFETLPSSSREEAERRLLDVLREEPSIAERVCSAVATRQNLALTLLIVLVWSVVNQVLAVHAGIHVDPFPFRGMQRALLGSSLVLAMTAARATTDRGRRIDRLRAAQRDFEEAVRWATTSRKLQIMGRTAVETERSRSTARDPEIR